MIKRHLTEPLLAALADTPVVMLGGARQTGKSTLAKWLASKELHPARYLTLDDATVLSAVLRDPEGFVSGLPGRVIIDEVQQAPDLLRAIKLEVDRRRTPGRFLLTGSANVLTLPRLSESLAGRMEILTLWPFSWGELQGVRERFVDRLFEADDPGGWTLPALAPQHVLHRAIVGGYPEVTQRRDPARRRAWFGAYVATILQRDIRALADIAGLAELPRLLTLLAAQCGGLLNMAELSRDVGLSQPTIRRYLTLLEATHLFCPLPAWAGNRRKRLVKSPRVFLNDSGLLACELGIDEQRVELPGADRGRLLEAFVCQELRKQITWSRRQPRLYYYRTVSGREVDFVLEARDGRVVGIEVKAAAAVRAADFRGLEDLADTVGGRLALGVVLYQGGEVVAFGPRLWAVPIGALLSQ